MLRNMCISNTVLLNSKTNKEWEKMSIIVLWMSDVVSGLNGSVNHGQNASPFNPISCTSEGLPPMPINIWVVRYPIFEIFFQILIHCYFSMLT